MTAGDLPPPPAVSLLPPSRPQLSAPGYRSGRLPVALVTLASAATATAAGASAAAHLHEFGVVGRLAPGGGSVAAATVERADATRVAASSAALVLLLATVVAMAAWSFVLTRNLRGLGVPGPRFSPGWAAGGWFVPVLNLWRPKQVVDDLWRTSEPGGTADGSWRLRPVAPLIHAWWVVWLASLATGWLGGGEPGVDVGALRLRLAVDAVAMTGLACAVTLGAAAALRITARQRRLAATHGLVTATSRSGPPLALAAIPVVLVVAAFATTLALLASWDGAGGGASAHGPAAMAVLVTDLEVADCFDSASMAGPASVELTTVDLADCDDPHAFQMFDELAHPADREAPYPGAPLEAFALDACVDRFDAAIGTPYVDSILDVVALRPTADSWQVGDRTIKCVAVRVDGASLTADVLGSGM